MYVRKWLLILLMGGGLSNEALVSYRQRRTRYNKGLKLGGVLLLCRFQVFKILGHHHGQQVNGQY